MAVATDPALETFSAAFEEFTRSLRRARGRASQDRGLLTVPQFHLLDALSSGPLGVQGLAEAAGIATPTATRMLDGLEDRGIIVRERGGTDRRCVRVRVTAEGDALMRERRAQVHRWRTDLFASLTPAERRSAARLLTRLAAAVEELP